MKKILSVVILSLICLSLASCSPRIPSNEFTVSFESFGGTAIADRTEYVVESEPVPEKEGYVFEGWYETADFSTRKIIFPYKTYQNLTLYAKYIDWEKGNEELSFSRLEDGSGYEAVSYTGTSSNVVIPAEYNGLPVKRAAEGFLKTSFYLVKLFFTSGLEEINETFYYCSNFTAFVKKDGGGAYTVVDGALYSDDGRTLICYPPAKRGADGVNAETEYRLPDGVEKIEKNAFRNAVRLKKIIFNRELTSIEENFRSLCSLKNFETALNSSFTADKGVLFTGDGKTLLAFPAASDNVEYSLPDGTETVREGALEKSCLQILNVNASLAEFGAQIELPALKAINVSRGNARFYSEDGVMFGSEGELIKYPAAREGESYVVPDGTVSLTSYSFWGLKFLKNATVSSDVERVASFAFGGDFSSVLESVSFEEDSRLTYIDGSAFAGCTKFRTLTLSSRRPPDTDAASLADCVETIRVPTNVLGLYMSLWRMASDKLSASGTSVTEYTVEFYSVGGSSVEDRECAFILTEPLPVKKGFKFLGWYRDAGYSGTRVSFPFAVDEDARLYAKWEEITDVEII